VTFKGKTALITGAARGIGQATALHFAREGATVAMVDRDGGAVESAAAEVNQARAGSALAIRTDVSSSADVNRAVETAVTHFNGLDILVNNAGIHFARAIGSYTDEEWQRIFSVNVNGAFYVTRAALPALRKSRGVIVMVSSMTALVGQDRGAAYVASKGALVSMTKALALELAADGIRVNCVCPAGVDTPLMRSWAATLPDPEAVLRGQAEMHLLKRLATADDIAQTIAFLASPASSFLTGTIIPVEGGATLGYRRV
jgi:NAD(P)-dependent dehydrogenase (short-subunit alcohol dehydrogenase family)